MATFSSQSNNGIINPDSRNMTWFAVSANNIVLIYVSSIGGVLYWMFQPVTFNGSDSPVYGVPSRVLPAVVGATGYRFPRACVIAPGKIVFNVATTLSSNMPSVVTNYLIDMDAQDRFSSLGAFGTIAITPRNSGCPVEPVGLNKVRVFYRSSALTTSVTYFDLTYNNNTLSAGAASVLPGAGSNANQVQGHITIKRGLDNGMLLTACWYGGLTYFRRHHLNPSGDPLADGAALGVSNTQTIMSAVPVRSTTGILMQDTVDRYSVYADNVSVKAGTLYRTDGLGVMTMDDSAWLDSSRFATLCINHRVDNLTNNEAIATIRSGAGKLLITQYDEGNMALTKADTFFDLGQNLCARWWQKSIHKIATRRLAIIHPRYDGSNNMILSVSVLSV